MIRGHLSFTSEAMNFSFMIQLDETKHLQKYMYDAFATKQCWDGDILWCLKKHLKEGSTFIDIGAHIGYFSLVARSIIGTTGRIIALEPNEENFDALITNVTLNKYENIRLYKAAAFDKFCRTPLFLCDDNDGAHALWPASEHPLNVKTKENNKLIMVDAVPFDEIVNKENIESPIDLMKIDVEGCEINAINGMNETITKGLVKNIVLEVNEFGLAQMGYSKNDLYSMMENHGYKKTVLCEYGLEPKDLVFNVLFERNHG